MMNSVFGCSDPYALFAMWLQEASAAEISDPTAMTLATVSSDGQPSARVVLMRGFDERGFTFFTNKLSAKAQQINQSNKAALCFHWKSIARQVRAEGVITPTSDEESDVYFRTRHPESQLGAWASAQSQPLQTRQELLDKLEFYRKKFGMEDIPRPDFWGGYRLIPQRLEFWQQGDYRLHDREAFYKTDAGWVSERLNP